MIKEPEEKELYHGQELKEEERFREEKIDKIKKERYIYGEFSVLKTKTMAYVKHKDIIQDHINSLMFIEIPPLHKIFLKAYKKILKDRNDGYYENISFINDISKIFIEFRIKELTETFIDLEEYLTDGVIDAKTDNLEMIISQRDDTINKIGKVRDELDRLECFILHEKAMINSAIYLHEHKKDK